MKHLALLLAFAASVFATTLTGTLKLPDGSGATGSLFFSLSQPGALSAANGCGGPLSLVPTKEIRVVVTNGTFPSVSFYGNDCILPQGTYYNVRFTDNNGNQIFTDRWILSGASIDIGTIVSVVVSGTTSVLGSTGVVLTNPTADQVIVQPSGTAVKANTLYVSDDFQALGGAFGCSTIGRCRFMEAIAFFGGFGTPKGVSNQLYIGPIGNFYNRVYTGPAGCVGIDDGWTGIRSDTMPPVFEVCVAGVKYTIPLQP